MPKKNQKLTRKEKIKASTTRFNNEVKKSLNTAIVAAFGFLIALAWRDLITEYVNSLTSISPVQGNLVSAIVITVVGVIGILITTTLIRKEE